MRCRESRIATVAWLLVLGVALGGCQEGQSRRAPEPVRRVALPMPPELEMPHKRGPVEIQEARALPAMEASAPVPPHAGPGELLKVPEASILSSRIAELAPSRRPACRSLTNRYRPRQEERSGDSVSLGSVVGGRLHEGSILPHEGEGYRVLDRTIRRGYVHGTSELVAAIERLGRTLAKRLPGNVLGVGNLSRPGGGDIPQSRSHNSGRDVDFAFFVVDSLGRGVVGREFVELNAAGASEDDGVPVFFDTRKNWEIVL